MGIVAATGVAVATNLRGTPLAAAIETAMLAAIETARDAGVTDSDDVRAAMLAARDKVIDNGC